MWDTRGLHKWQSQYNAYNDIYYGLKVVQFGVVWIAAKLPWYNLCMLLDFPQRWWLQCRVGLLYSEEASSRPRTMMYRWMHGWLAGSPWWIVAAETGAVAGLNECGWEACPAERCSARYTKHRGRAVGRSFFLLDVSAWVVERDCFL